MKRLFVICILFCGVAMPSYASSKYDYKQLQIFEDTNECIGCNLRGAPLSRNHALAKLDNADLSLVVAHEINLSFSSLLNTNFSGADLEYANFKKANLTGANLTGALLSHANLEGAIGAELSNVAEICSATLPDGRKTTPC